MARNVFKRRRAESLSVGARAEQDQALVKRFKLYCKEQGLSVQRGLLNVIASFLDGDA